MRSRGIPPTPPRMLSLRISSVCRSGGHSAPAAAAYQARDKLTDIRKDVEHDYTRLRVDLAHAELIGWQGTRAELWNTAEASEKRKDSRVARRIIVSLPANVSANDRRLICRDFAEQLRNEYGVAVDMAIHRPHRTDDPRNHHAHLLITTRVVDEGRFGDKTRRLDMATTSAKEVVRMREWLSVAAIQHGADPSEWDHRSYRERGLDREPTEHEGRAARALAKRGEEVEVVRANEERRSRNAEREERERATIEQAKALYEHHHHQASNTEFRGTHGGVREADSAAAKDRAGASASTSETAGASASDGASATRARRVGAELGGASAVIVGAIGAARGARRRSRSALGELRGVVSAAEPEYEHTAAVPAAKPHLGPGNPDVDRNRHHSGGENLDQRRDHARAAVVGSEPVLRRDRGGASASAKPTEVRPVGPPQPPAESEVRKRVQEELALSAAAEFDVALWKRTAKEPQHARYTRAELQVDGYLEELEQLVANGAELIFTPVEEEDLDLGGAPVVLRPERQVPPQVPQRQVRGRKM